MNLIKTKISNILDNLDNILFSLILFLFAFIPLYPKFPFINVGGTFVAVRLEDLLIAVIFILWAIFIFKYKNFRFFSSSIIYQSYLLFFAIGALSLFSAIFLTHTATFSLGLLHFFRRVEYMLLLPIVVTIFTTKKRLIISLVVLFLTILTVNIYGLGQQFLDWPIISTTNSEFSKGLILRLTPGARINSTFAGHYDLAVFLASALAFFTTLFFAVNKWWKISIFISGVLSLFVLVLTAARVSFVAAFIGIIFALIFSKRKKYLLITFILLILAAIYPSQLRDRFISTITINIFNLGQRYEGRNLSQQLENKLNIPTLYYKMASRSANQPTFASAEAGIPVDIAPGEPIDETELAVYRSFNIRFNIEWPKAVNAFLKNPFLGIGYSSLGLATDNDFLRSLGEVGLLGTIAFFFILLLVWKKIFKGLKKEDKIIRFFCAGGLSMILVFLANGTFIDVFEASKVALLFWMVLGLTVAAVRIK